MQDMHHTGKQFQCKEAWDQLVAIKTAACVHGGLYTPLLSNLIAATKASGAYSSVVPQKVWCTLCMYVDSGTKLTSALIKAHVKPI